MVLKLFMLRVLAIFVSKKFPKIFFVVLLQKTVAEFFDNVIVCGPKTIVGDNDDRPKAFLPSFTGYIEETLPQKVLKIITVKETNEKTLFSTLKNNPSIALTSMVQNTQFVEYSEREQPGESSRQVNDMILR